MRSIQRLQMSALAAALVFAAMAGAQTADQILGIPRKIVRPAPISVEEVVERIMAFDRNKDGKVTRDELPERMQFLIALGDTNKDGALDRDEIRKLAARQATTPGGVGFRADFGRRVGLGGFGVGGAIRVPGPGPDPGPSAIEGVVDDLKLSGRKKDRALAAVKAHEEHVRKLMDQARADLLQRMKEILSAEEFQDFEAALDRPRGGITIVNVGPLDARRSGDAAGRLGQLPKEPDDSRREPRR